MKTVLFHHPDLGNNKIFTPNSSGRDRYGLDPFIYLKEKLHSLGYKLMTSDDNPLTDCVWVIFLNSPSSKFIRPNGIKNKLKSIKSSLFGKRSKEKPRDLYRECVDSGFKNISIILWDNDAICPGNFSKILHEKFPIIFTWNDSYIDNKKFFKFYHPIARELPEVPKIPFKEKKMLVNISRNRYSSDPNELYSARRKSIIYFEKNFPNDFDLYGYGWNKPAGRLQNLFPFLVHKFSSYRGSIESKAEVLSQYKFSLAYENLEGENGYISEKIFDCFRCNTVPIYWGAPNVEEFIDPETFIDRSKFKSDKELADFIIKINEKKYNQYLAAINAYLKSEKYKLFSAENFADTIIRVLNL